MEERFVGALFIVFLVVGIFWLFVVPLALIFIKMTPGQRILAFTVWGLLSLCLVGISLSWLVTGARSAAMSKAKAEQEARITSLESSGNLLANGGFEDDPVKPDPWFVQGDLQAFYFALDLERPAEGKRSAWLRVKELPGETDRKVRPEDTGVYRAAWAQEIDVNLSGDQTAFGTFTASVQGTLHAKVSYAITALDRNGKTVANASSTGRTPEQAWSQLWNSTVPLVPGMQRIRVELWCEGPPGAAAWFDEVEIRIGARR